MHRKSRALAGSVVVSCARRVSMDPRALIPAVAAIAFIAFLLWKMRPASVGRRRPVDPHVAEARARATRLDGRARAVALCEAGARSNEAARTVAAFGYYLRALRADLTYDEPIRGLARTLGRRRASLERVLWRHLASLDWASAQRTAARTTLEELISLYRRGRDRPRAEALGKVLTLLSTPDLSAPPAPHDVPESAQSSGDVPPPDGERGST
jgi:hypothetical protein